MVANIFYIELARPPPSPSLPPLLKWRPRACLLNSILHFGFTVLKKVSKKRIKKKQMIPF